MALVHLDLSNLACKATTNFNNDRSTSKETLHQQVNTGNFGKVPVYKNRQAQSHSTVNWIWSKTKSVPISVLTLAKTHTHIHQFKEHFPGKSSLLVVAIRHTHILLRSFQVWLSS